MTISEAIANEAWIDAKARKVVADVEANDNGRSKEWREGYERAISDMLARFREMGMENCSDESWRRFTGRG